MFFTFLRQLCRSSRDDKEQLMISWTVLTSVASVPLCGHLIISAGYLMGGGPNCTVHVEGLAHIFTIELVSEYLYDVLVISGSASF